MIDLNESLNKLLDVAIERLNDNLLSNEEKWEVLKKANRLQGHYCYWSDLEKKPLLPGQTSSYYGGKKEFQQLKDFFFLGNSFFITHYFPDSAPLEGWKRLSFLSTCDLAKDVFYLGFSGKREINKNEITSEMEYGTIVPLNEPIQTDGSKVLWLDKDSNIWLANKDNPLGANHERIMILKKV